MTVDNQSLGVLGAIIAFMFAAFGSAFGAYVCASAVIGAWKRNYIQGKAASTMLLGFIGMTLSQTIYGMLLMNAMTDVAQQGANGLILCIIGVMSGIVLGLSAFAQGRASAVAADAFGETGKGFGNAIAAVGVIEVSILFLVIFAIGSLDLLVPATTAVPVAP